MQLQMMTLDLLTTVVAAVMGYFGLDASSSFLQTYM